MPPPSRVRLPCLTFNSGKYSDAPILFNLSERKSVLSNMDELTGNTTWATPHGWFLVRPQTPATTFLWNPSNGDKIQLPPLHEDVPADCTCLLSDEPTVVSGGGCVVLLLEMMGPVLWYCRVAGGGADDAGGREWARHEYDIGTQILYPDETLHEKLVVPWQLLLLLHGLRGAGRDRVPPDAGVQLRGHARGGHRGLRRRALRPGVHGRVQGAAAHGEPALRGELLQRGLRDRCLQDGLQQARMAPGVGPRGPRVPHITREFCRLAPG